MSTVTNEHLRKLLLRHLPPEEVARTEEAILTEDGVAERLRDEEFDLIDDYARGKLTETERADMERYVLTTPEHVESIRLARALAGRQPEVVAAARSASVTGVLAPAIQTRRKGSHMLPVAALLAAGLAAVAFVPLWAAYMGPAGVSAPVAVPDTLSSVQRGPDQTVTLLADTERGGSTRVVNLLSGAVIIRLQTEVPGPSSDVSYSLRVDDAAGTAVFEKSGLSTLVSGPYTFVEAEIPAELLSTGTRTILLAVDGAAGANSAKYRWRINAVRDDAGAAQTK